MSRSFPHRIHQTWKSHSLPEPMRGRSHTWRAHHPGWEFTLWNDTENRDFIASQYAWFLPYYDVSVLYDTITIGRKAS